MLINRHGAAVGAALGAAVGGVVHLPQKTEK
jgi:hypothetical protein